MAEGVRGCGLPGSGRAEVSPTDLYANAGIPFKSLFRAQPSPLDGSQRYTE
jgi:hypothetical protein